MFFMVSNKLLLLIMYIPSRFAQNHFIENKDLSVVLKLNLSEDQSDYTIYWLPFYFYISENKFLTRILDPTIVICVLRYFFFLYYNCSFEVIFISTFLINYQNW